MPKNEIFAKFAKQLQADGMPLSVGVLYNNMHNQEFFDNLYGILQADGMQMDKQTFAKNLGLGTISSDYKTLGIDGKQNQVPIKTTPTTPKVTPITTQQPKPTAVVPNFNIPSVIKDIKTDERIVNSPIPSATSIETVPIKPSTLDVSKVEAKAKIQEQAFKGGYYPTGEEQPLIFEGKQYNENIAPIKREALPKYDKLFIDDILGDNANFTDKYNNTYLEKSDIEYQEKQSGQSGYNEFKYTKSNYDRQFNALKEYESKLNQSISNKFNTSDILTDIQKENESLNSELSKLEKLKSVNEPLLKSIESDITLLNNRYQNGQIDENAYRAEFAALKARHETINQEINKKTSAIQEQQRQFQSKYSDKEVSDLLRVKQKQFEVAKEGANIINDPKFAKIKEGQANADKAQKIADSKKKLELQLQNKEIDFNKYSTEVEKLDKAKNIQVNAQAFIADKTWNLVSQIATLPRTISGNFENNYGFVDKVADWANHMSEVKQKQTPYSSDIQVNTFQKFAQVGDLRVLLDDKGDAYDVRDNKYFSIDQAQAEQTLKQYNDNKKAYKVYNQTNADVFTKNALSTIADVGVLMLGTKGLGALAGGGKLSSTLIGGGVAFTQVQNDLYKQGIESGLNPQDASRFATMVGTSISLISFINPTEYKLAGAGGLFPSIRQNALSQADVALINSGEMSVTQIAGKYAKGIAKNIVGENFEELIGEPLAQDLISNLYESRIANDGEGFTKQFDPISKQGLETLLLTSVVAIPFGAMEVNQEMPHYQAMAMQSAIENPQAYIDVLKKRKEMGIIDDAQMNAQLLQMQEISEVYNSVSSEIKDERKPELAGLLAKKNVALNKIKEIKDDVLSNNWKAKLEKINEDIQSIVDNKATKNNLVANEGIQLEDKKTETQQEKPIKVFSDFDNTLFDPTTQTLTPLGEEMKLRIEAGEDIEIVTARENTKENVDLIAEQLGIDASKITLGLTPEMKAEKVDEFEGKSQFIDDNTDNLQAVEGLGNDNVEVVPIVSKKETLFSKLSADVKANKEAKKLEKEQLAKSQEIPLNEKGEVDLPKIAADAIEVKTEAGSVVGGVPISKEDFLEEHIQSQIDYEKSRGNYTEFAAKRIANQKKNELKSLKETGNFDSFFTEEAYKVRLNKATPQAGSGGVIDGKKSPILKEETKIEKDSNKIDEKILSLSYKELSNILNEDTDKLNETDFGIYNRFKEYQQNFKAKDVLPNIDKYFNDTPKEDRVKDGDVIQFVKNQISEQPIKETPKEKSKSTITPSKTNRKVLDEKLREEIDNALDEFKKTLGNLNIGVNPETLIKGTKLVALYTKAGVYKFSDVISDIYAKFGEISKEFFDGIKQSYSAYYSTADNNIADQMDGNIRGITYESIIDKIKQENGNNNQQQSEKQGESSPIGALQPNSKRLSKREPQESLFEPNKRGRVGTRSQSQSKPISTTTTDVEQPTTGQGDLLSTNVGVLETEGKTTESKPKDKVELQIEQINQAEKQEPALVDFAMQDNEQDKFNATKKYTDNINALETLLNIIKEKRKATAKEKNILAKYVGFGGLKEIAFNPDNDTDWKESTTKYKAQVRKVMELTKELDQALGINNSLAEIRAGILTAHYTPKTIIDTMFNVLERLGFKNGNILEPSAGIGNFIGYMPSKMRSNSKINAVELDNITGSILKYLYDDVNTQITGIQDALILDNSQDVVISNVPFGAFKVFDKAFKGTREFLTKRIHNYFFAKALDKVREGGIVMFVTSRICFMGTGKTSPLLAKLYSTFEKFFRYSR